MLPLKDIAAHSDTTTPSKELWKTLQLYSIYRFILSATCLVIAYQNKLIPIFGQFSEGHPTLFLHTSAAYLLFAIFNLLLSLIQKPNYSIQANVGIFLEIAFLIVIMHACGGVLSGIGLLFILLAAAHSILYPGKLSFLSAALISIGLLLEYFYAKTYGYNLLNSSNQVGLLGLIVFATSLLTNFLSLKARKNQAIILKQAKQLASSFQLNSFIVDLMQQGVIVLDSDQNIRIINLSAQKLLGIPLNEKAQRLSDLPTSFQHCVLAWLMKQKNLSPIQINPMYPKVRLDFQSIDPNNTPGLIIFIYDFQAETRKAQDLKLSSLGHLTANIAHELRNPLGAASHAAQILMESEELNQENVNLAVMIQQNCERMNQVIKNVLSISGQKSNIKILELNRWIKENVHHLKFTQYPNAQIIFSPSEEELWVGVDPSQLMQIIVNLCENGLRYSEKKIGKPTVSLHTQSGIHPHGVYLDIIDQGDGIPEENRDFVFEPFFTTEKTGTGLGLYLARELSQINGAHIDYCQSTLGSQFRIIFPHEINT
ncbi:MAG: nitrogen regulation protein NR(II) [Candidatus Berkiella sp.]